MALYTMNQLQAELDRTPQQIRKVLKTKDKLIKLLPQHRIEKDNGRVFYDDAILEALKEYFGLSISAPAVDEEVGGGVEDTENAENPTNNPPPPTEEDSKPAAATEAEIEALQGQIEALKKQLEEEQANREKEKADLEKQLHDKEAERLHFVGENAKLLNLLAAEKQEKNQLLLLMPPAGAAKKSVWGKFKGLFTREKEAAKSE